MSDNKPNGFKLSSLYDWQKSALAAWTKAEHKGIVEAVTGTGKTHVGIGAIAMLHAQERRLSILVVVHTIELMNQWHERLQAAFPGRRVARIGGGIKEDFSIMPVACVGIVNSALPRLADLFEHHQRGPWKSLLIADECHHYIDAPVFSRLLRFPFDFTLGLSATIDPFEVEGLGRIIFEYSFEQAHSDGLVPPFSLVNIGVDLTPDERTAYLELTDKIRDQFKLIFELYGDELNWIPDYKLFTKLKQMMRQGKEDDPVIKRVFIYLFKRASIYYKAFNKMRLAQQITRLLVDHGRKKLIVFFERIESAETTVEDISVICARKLQMELREGDAIWCKVYHSGLRRKDRVQILGEFKNIGASALLACRSLDEGVDIPTVDAAMLAASTQSKRQRIQRIGRTLRRGDGGKRPIVITLFARGTGDENVCADDLHDFKGVATIYDESEQTCISRVEALLRDADAPPVERSTTETPEDDGAWTVLAENDPVPLRNVSSLLNRFRDREIRVRCCDGAVETGILALHR